MMTTAQYTKIATSHNSCSADSSPSAGIEYLGTYLVTNKVQNEEVPYLYYHTSQDGLMELLRLIATLASIVNERLADSLLKCLAENHGSVRNFLNHFKA